MYALLEHSIKFREKAEQISSPNSPESSLKKHFLAFLPAVAPIKCLIAPLSSDANLNKFRDGEGEHLPAGRRIEYVNRQKVFKGGRERGTFPCDHRQFKKTIKCAVDSGYIKTEFLLSSKDSKTIPIPIPISTQLLKILRKMKNYIGLVHYHRLFESNPEEEIRNLLHCKCWIKAATTLKKEQTKTNSAGRDYSSVDKFLKTQIRE